MAPEKIFLIRPGGGGDAVGLVPAINAIKTAFPSVTIDILAEKRNSAVFGLCPQVRSVFCYDKPNGFLSLRANARYDLVIDTEQWHRLSAIIARFTRAPLLIGYGTNDRKKLFTHPVSYSHDEYEAESFLNLLAPLGIEKPSEIKTPFLQVPIGAMESMERIVDKFEGRPFVTIFPGASIPERRWGARKFREVADRLRGIGISVVVVGGTGEAADGEVIVIGNSGLNLAGKTSMAETAAMIAKSALLVSGDSGVLHIGVGLGKPTVSLFGPGIAKKWAPKGGKHVVINRNLSCSPCTKFGYTPKCDRGAECMELITVDEVTEAVKKIAHFQC